MHVPQSYSCTLFLSYTNRVGMLVHVLPFCQIALVEVSDNLPMHLTLPLPQFVRFRFRSM